MSGYCVDDGGNGRERSDGATVGPAPESVADRPAGEHLGALVALEDDGSATVTLFPTYVDEHELLTRWVTADIEAVADLEAMR